MLQIHNAEGLATPDDCELAETIAKADPGVQAMLKERGITRLDLVACDPWSGNLSSHSPPNVGTPNACLIVASHERLAG